MPGPRPHHRRKAKRRGGPDGESGEHQRAERRTSSLARQRPARGGAKRKCAAATGGGMEKAREQAEAIAKVDLVRGQTDLAQIAERETNYAGAVAIYESLIKAWAPYH